MKPNSTSQTCSKCGKSRPWYLAWKDKKPVIVCDQCFDVAAAEAEYDKYLAAMQATGPAFDVSTAPAKQMAWLDKTLGSWLPSFASADNPFYLPRGQQTPLE